MAGAERVFATLALDTTDGAPVATLAAKEDGRPPIRLDDFVFGYAPRPAVLHGISLTVNPGEHVALVGRTGAGKTSALQLLAGLYAPWAGTVRIAGRDAALVDQTEPRGLP